MNKIKRAFGQFRVKHEAAYRNKREEVPRRYKRDITMSVNKMVRLIKRRGLRDGLGGLRSALVRRLLVQLREAEN